MCSHPDLMPESYNRYLINGLRADLDMPGTPIRLYMRSQSDKNPFRAKKEKKVTKLNKHTEGRFRKEAGRGVKPKK